MTIRSNRASPTTPPEGASANSGEQERLNLEATGSPTRMTEIVGVLAHQVRNPLGAIKNAAYLMNLALGSSAPPDVTQAIAIIHDEVKRANEIITGLLDLVRVRPARPRSTQLVYLVEQAIGGLSLAEGTTVERALDDAVLVNVDPGQTQLALFHLCRHALAQMRPGIALLVDSRVVGQAATLTLRDADFDQAEVEDPEKAIQGPPLDLSMGPLTARVLVENQGGSVVIERRGRSLAIEVRLPFAESL